MDTQVETAVAEQHAGGTVALAEIFNITHNAVSNWGEYLPDARSYELRLKKPDWFFKNGNIRPFFGDAVTKQKALKSQTTREGDITRHRVA